MFKKRIEFIDYEKLIEEEAKFSQYLDKLEVFLDELDRARNR